MCVCAYNSERDERVWVGEKRGWVCSGILLFTSNQNGAAGRKEAWEAAWTSGGPCGALEWALSYRGGS